MKLNIVFSTSLNNFTLCDHTYLFEFEVKRRLGDLELHQEIQLPPIKDTRIILRPILPKVCALDLRSKHTAHILYPTFKLACELILK